MSTKQKIRVTAEVIIIFVLLLTIWPLTLGTGYTESATSAIGTLAILIGAVEIFLYRKSRIQAKAKESDPSSREELERAADGTPTDSLKTTEDVAQPVQTSIHIERSINDFDTLEIKIPTDTHRGTPIPFKLSSTANENLKTEWVDLSSTDAAMLYFLGREKKEEGESWLVSPTDHPELLEEILKVFSDSLEPRLKQELAGHEHKTRKSWVYGSANTKSGCARRIHTALREQAKIKKARGDRHGPLLFPCSTKTQLGGFNLPTIKHFIPPST